MQLSWAITQNNIGKAGYSEDGEREGRTGDCEGLRDAGMERGMCERQGGRGPSKAG